MGSNYCHLSESDRVLMSVMLAQGCSKAKIADALDVHRSTIYRELKRNRVLSKLSL